MTCLKIRAEKIERRAQAVARVRGWHPQCTARVLELGANAPKEKTCVVLTRVLLLTGLVHRYTCCVRSYNAQLDTYGVEFDVFKNTQTCHASQLYPILEEPQDVVLSSHNSPLVSSAEGAEGTLLGPERRDDTRKEKLQKLSSIEKQKVDHSRQLRKISSYESDKMNVFRREERLSAMTRFALPSQKTSRLLALHQMGPSRVAAFPDRDNNGAINGNDNNNHGASSNSSDQDSESSSSYTAIGRTLDELIASGKTADTINAGGSIRKRFSVLFKPKASDVFAGGTPPLPHDGSSDSSAEENLESSVFLDVPVSGTRSLRIKARKASGMAASEVFAKEEEGRSASSPDLRELLSGYNPRNASFKDFKVKKGSESLINLVRLLRTHHTTLEEEAPEETVSSSVELLVGNRCSESSQSDNIVWTLFVEELHTTTSCIESVAFGPLPPNGEVVVLKSAPFTLSRESALLFLESMDFQLKVSVKFVDGKEPALFRHDLNVPGSWGHFEADRVTGTVRQISVHTTEQKSEPAAIKTELSGSGEVAAVAGTGSGTLAPAALDVAALEAKIRQIMEKESLSAAEEIVRYAERIGRDILVRPLKKQRNPSYCINALRCRTRAFLIRGAKARGVVKEQASREGDDQALVGETVNLAVEVSQLASDQIQGSQFVSSMSVVLCSTFHPVKSLILAAKTVQECLDKWATILRPGGKAQTVTPFVASVEDFRSKMEVTVRSPPPVFDEEELATRVASEVRKREEMIAKRKALVSSKHKGLIFEKLAQEDEETLLMTPPMQRPPTAVAEESAAIEASTVGEEDTKTPPSAASVPFRAALLDLDSAVASQPLVDMPGNPLMSRSAALMSPGRSGNRESYDAATPSSSSSSPEPDFSMAIDLFKPVDFLEISRARTEDILLRTNVANYFKSMVQHEGRVKESIVCELFAIIANPLVSSTIMQLPNFKKSVQRVRTILKLIHVAAAIVKTHIRNVGRAIFHKPHSAAACLSVLFQTLLPLENALEGDAQLQIMHETIRMGHFCDIMELLRMFFREPLLHFLSDTKVAIVGVPFHPVSLLIGRLEHDGVNNLFPSLLGAELVLPRKVWFSDKGDIISVLLAKMVVPVDASDVGAENASHVLKKVVSSLDHVGLNLRLIELHRTMFRQTFGPCMDPPDAEFSVWHEKQFRFTIRVLSDWALMTLGKFRAVEEKLHQECVATVVSFLPVVKEMLLHSFPREPESLEGLKVGFVRLELINYLAMLINARCAKVDDALLQLDIIPAVVNVFFATKNSSMLHSSVTEFILVPICEDHANRLLAGAIHKV